MEQRIAEIITEQKAVLDGELLVTIVRKTEAGDVIVNAGHATMVVGPERLTPLA